MWTHGWPAEGEHSNFCKPVFSNSRSSAAICWTNDFLLFYAFTVATVATVSGIVQT